MAKSIYSKRVKKLTSYKRKQYTKSYAKKLFKVANERIRSLDKSKKTSPAINKLKRSGINNFNIKGKNESQIYNMYNQVINFLNNPTSLLSGLKQYSNFIEEKYDLSGSSVELLINLEQLPIVNDYLFMISRTEYYEVANGYRDIQEVLSEQGFNEDINDFQVEIEMLSNEMRQVTLSRLGSENNFNLLG